MKFSLRPYQQEAVDAAICYMRVALDPALIVAATGAGKSLIVAKIAMWLHEVSGKKVLCLAPSKELTEQNSERYRAYGNPASLWSASAGEKDMRHNVVFGTPISVWNDIQYFGEQYAGVVLDEAHTLTPTIIKIIEAMRERNPNLRVLGLTATHYRMGSGFIHAINEDGTPVDEDQTRNPYFKKLLYSIPAKALIEQGYLTEPVADAELVSNYDTSNIVLKRNGQFDSATVEQAFEGQGRLTSAIVADVIDHSYGKMGVMFFAATVQHAHEIMESLPHDNARVVTGSTPKKEREDIINGFKARRFKYLVNVSVLTTGFDAPHVDVVAILRATESAGLLQQIIGRGLRLHEDKALCLVLDYAGNIERHGLEDDLFNPEIKVSGGGSSDSKIEALCRGCGTVNSFSKRPERGEVTPNHDEEGYCVDLMGDRVVVEGQPLPAHFGRRCNGQQLIKGRFERCENRWSFKACPECDEENDIAARYCTSCKHELVDPNLKLAIDYKKMKADPRALSTDKVIGWHCQEWQSLKGNVSMRVDYTTEYRTFPVWYTPDSNSQRQRNLWSELSQVVFGEGKIAPSIDKFLESLHHPKAKMPVTVTCRKEGDFFKVFAHNRAEDKNPND